VEETKRRKRASTGKVEEKSRGTSPKKGTAKKKLKFVNSLEKDVGKKRVSGGREGEIGGGNKLGLTKHLSKNYA